jgi:hypothetical protein
MKVIALASTYPASALGEADFAITKLAQIQVDLDGERKLRVTIG